MPDSINLKLEPKVLDYILQVVQQRPWVEANPVIQELLKQANSQGAVNGPEPVSAG